MPAQRTPATAFRAVLYCPAKICTVTLNGKIQTTNGTNEWERCFIPDVEKKRALLTNLQATNSVTSEGLSGFLNLSYAALHFADRVELGKGTVK